MPNYDCRPDADTNTAGDSFTAANTFTASELTEVTTITRVDVLVETNDSIVEFQEPGVDTWNDGIVLPAGFHSLPLNIDAARIKNRTGGSNADYQFTFYCDVD